ncbi:MAG TPA: ComEC/Rec2 family competence protein [Solirubrobacterales bacterium]|jgi:competence protein ComEC|nr:ComEC/Rec2 family competence protein [Solirubrobacterales bacterium]
MRSPRISLPVLIGVGLVVALAVARAGEIRERAEAGLGEGMPPREAALARGFVLGDDGELDQGTNEDFIRAGLSHLTAVSGENVTLLALLAMPILAMFGVPLRERLLWTIGLIAVYVPLAGSGPSIQRAGIMGAVGLLATLQGRRTSRLYALALAAVVTLAIDPGVASNVGWQLSFAAVLGILLLASPIREWLIVRVGRRSWRRALAEGIAVTVAATLATAPLIAYVFEEISLTSLLANVLALPAVAPAMWLGMVSAALAQIPGMPLAPLNGLDALLLAYIAQIAAWCGRPTWAVLHVHIGLLAMLATYAAMATSLVAAKTAARARRLTVARANPTGTATAVDLSYLSATAVDPSSAWVNPSRPQSAERNEGRPRFQAPGHAIGPKARLGRGRRGLRPVGVALGLVSVAALVFVAVRPRGNGAPPGAVPGLRIEVLDVGQGDAILLQPRSAPAVLVDGGPPGDELVAKLHEEGIDRLGAAIVTHDQSDHAAGIAEALGRVPIARLVYGRLDREYLANARDDGADPDQVAAGTTLRSGSLRLEVLWPPPDRLAEAPADTDPNELALVIRARWHDFTMLLTADAEAESTPLEPGSIDVLKVAHHGSDDAGLGALLDRIRPRLAVISVGAHNAYGHPTPGTLATLAAHHVPMLRTDLDGTIEIDVRRRTFSVDSN